MSREKRLGRGLAALLSTPGDDVGEGVDESGLPRLHETPESPPTESDAGNSDRPRGGGLERLLLLPVDDIDPNPFQPRREFRESEIDSLAESLKEHDQLQPILVRQVEGRWQLISGERRWRAAKRAGIEHIRAQQRDADDRLVAELAIVENLQRKDLNPLEKALSFQRYLDEHRCRQEDLAKRLKIDRSTIANLLRLLELPTEVQDALRRGTITAGHARALLPLGDSREQISFCDRIRRDGVSVRETERLVQEKIAMEDGDGLAVAGNTAKAKQKARSQQLGLLEQEMRRALGTKVDIRTGSRGRGKIVIHFNSHEEFERIRDYLSDEEFPAAGVG